MGPGTGLAMVSFERSACACPYPKDVRRPLGALTRASSLQAASYRSLHDPGDKGCESSGQPRAVPLSGSLRLHTGPSSRPEWPIALLRSLNNMAAA